MLWVQASRRAGAASRRPGRDAAHGARARAQPIQTQRGIDDEHAIERNELTRSAKPGTVKAAELLQIHSFRQVHQLISTITCQIREGITTA